MNAETGSNGRAFHTRAGWRWALLGVVALYLGLASVLASTSPGLQYDEALLVHGAVHMLHAGDRAPTFAHGRGSWLPLAGRWWPVNIISYMGAEKDYLALPLFAIFGPRVGLSRMLSAALTALGIFGFGMLVARRTRPAAGVAASLILAVHPSFLAQSVFDESGLSTWMAAFGLSCLALAAVARRSTSHRAFLLGLALGLGVWVRLNFLWLLAAVAAAALLVAGRRLAARRRDAPWIAAGALVGMLPMIGYEVVSRFATLRFIAQSPSAGPLRERLVRRLASLATLFVDDAQSRAMWDGPAPPAWQIGLLTGLVLVATVVLLVPRRGGPAEETTWERGFAIALLLYSLLLASSRLGVKPHHLVTILPFAAAVAVLGLARLTAAARPLRWAVVAAGVLYLGIAGWWDAAAVAGLRRTGGVGPWSDAIGDVTAYLVSHPTSERPYVLDWGYGNSIYVLSDGAIEPREIFWDASEETAGGGRSWREVVAGGGVFVSDGERSQGHLFAAAVRGFEAALAASDQPRRRVVFRSRDGRFHTEIVVVEPAGSH